MALKAGLTAFVACLVPIYWSAYGPTVFLFFCDVALFLTLVAVWTERPLPVSVAAAGLILPQLLWVVDLAGTLLGHPPFGMTNYMFDELRPLAARLASLFHGWLPLVMLYLIAKIGYDRRAFKYWTALAWGLMVASFFFIPCGPPPADQPILPVNVNFVYGLGNRPQEAMHPYLWLGLVMTGMPLLLNLPAHLALAWGAKKFGAKVTG